MKFVEIMQKAEYINWKTPLLLFGNLLPAAIPIKNWVWF